MAAHKSTTVKGDRGISFAQSELIYQQSGTLVPIGSRKYRIECKLALGSRHPRRLGIERSLRYRNPDLAKQKQEPEPEQNRKENWNKV